MKDGYIKVGCVSFDTNVGSPILNTKNIIKCMNNASKKEVKILVFPELCISGYTCGDLFYQDLLLEGCLDSLENIKRNSSRKDMLIIVGLPLKHNSKLYNVACFINKGKILGFVPKTYIPNYNEFYESRYFTPSFKENTKVIIRGNEYPFGVNLLFKCKSVNDLVVAAEICEDLWVPSSPSINHALNGATVICNLSASNEVVGKEKLRLDLVKFTSRKLCCAYLYSSAGEGESTQDLVFSSHQIIAENGVVLKESEIFKNSLITSEIDIKKIAFERSKMNTFNKDDSKYEYIYFDLKVSDTTLERRYPSLPFIPIDNKTYSKILDIQAYGLKKTITHTHTKKLIIGISGGLDSTLAILVMVRALDLLKRSHKDIIAITLPCFGTTDLTKSNAYKLCKELDVDFREINISDAVTQHFKDINHDPNVYDVTFENSQARERTQVLMDVANKENGLVIGTGDLSELALGWATYNGDHMSMYAVNSGIPKTLIRYMISYISKTTKNKKLKEVLDSINDTPVSPELIPPKEGEISQITEDLVGPYELHDYFLYYGIRCGFSPKKVYRIALDSFENRYTKETILKWMKVFYRRFFNQQFKRSCLPDGVKVGSVSLSPRGDLRMPSDALSNDWLKELEKIV